MADPLELDLSGPIREALLGSAPLIALLATWEGYPSIHTAIPVPEDVTYPFATVPPAAAIGNFDALVSRRPIVQRDVIIYGQQPDHYRDVEAAAFIVRKLFHENRWAITVPGYQVVRITADGPVPAPTDDQNEVARAVMLRIALRDLAP